jgi:alpha-mannosidase II
MPSGAFIQDSSKRLNILSGQPLGVASQDQSSLQVFLDRKLDQDDNRGMEQAVDDNVLTSSKFLVFFEEINEDNFGKSLAKNHPSLLSQILSFHLINPIIRLVSTVKVSSTFKSNVKLAGENNLFPCDLRLCM